VPSPDRHDDALAKIGDLAASAGIKRVHMLAWRDLEDVEAGGSELHAANVARLWAEAGLEVVQRTSYAQGQPPRARRDGYEVIRRAGRYLVFPRAVGSELLGRHGERDALVEIWNGMPFFSPLWARGPKVVLLHHVHADMWKMVLGDETPMLATAGDLLERRIAPLAYRRTRVVTLSQSSKDEIVEQMRLRADRVDVVPPGIDPAFSPGGQKTAHASVVAVGRLMPVKRFDVLIRAAALARESRPDLTLTIVGEGYERDALAAMVRDAGADEWVRLHGRASEAELIDLYRSSWLVASASAREGWGMTLTEAAACGTPCVATRIAGHLDATGGGASGVLVGKGEEALAGGIRAVVNDDALRARLSAAALDLASRFTWEATATGVMRALAAAAQPISTQ
jgi:glycosyltransferase involved in cell wall biosynthesis